MDVTQTLNEVMTMGGALGAALVDMTSGMALGTIGGGGIDLDIAAAGNTEVVKAKLRTMEDLGIQGQIEDILITLSTQYHLIRPLGSDSTVFLYVVLNKAQANLAMARRTLAKIEAGLQL
ncbi:MAG: hypothetical protein JOZ51_25600 [Chloroflexi bacterium]|nr:hypothetical protein [Chloroflexota bacterium]